MTFTKMKMIYVALFTVIPMIVSGFTLERKAIDYDRYEGLDKLEQKVKEAGNLSGKKDKKDKTRVLATFEYDFDIPKTGWYTVEVPGGWAIEYEMDKKVYGIGHKHLGSFYLTAGKHALMLRKRNWFNSWRKVEKIVIKDAPDTLADRLRVTGEHFVSEGIIRKGGHYRLNVTAGSPEEETLQVLVNDRKSGKTVDRLSLEIPAKDVYHTKLNVPAKETGIFDIVFMLNGKKLKQLKFSMAVIDASPAFARIGTELKKTLLQEIDCADKEPDYLGGGKTRVIKKSFGNYRESGKVSWLTHMNSREPSWFAYSLNVPEKEKHYLVEIDYPDDAYRTYVAAVRNAGQTSYPVAGGVDSGHEYPISNSMKTMTLFFWARDKATRLVIANACDGQRGAAAKIRLYRIDSKVLPLLVNPEIDGRCFNNWYEEGSGFVGLFGGNYKRKTADEFIKTADRWANTFAYMGGNVLYPTLMVYQFGLNPSEYNVFATRATTDLAEILLLTAEKYGMKVMFDFHPEARDLKFDSTGKNAFRNRTGNASKRAPMHGPLYPKNQEWLCSLVSEFANRYKHSKAFKGIEIRQMKWYNHALNNFHNLDWGYDDYTVGLFEKETGVKIAGIKGNDDPARYETRYDFLTSEQNKEKWINWRCTKITQLYKKLADILKKVRPDLVINSHDLGKESGVDSEQLAQIDNVVMKTGIAYGRRGRGECSRHKFLKIMMNPNPYLDTIISGSAYFEATGVVIPPEQLGFSKKTKRTWMSAVVNPAGRFILERFALALAVADSKELQDGGNAYTIGQLELRDFMKEFRVLPKSDFKIVANASDPVTVRENGGYFYIVNMMPFPVECNISFKGNSYVFSPLTLKSEDVSRLKLKAYELRTFRSMSPINDVQVKIPETEKQKLKNQLAVLKANAASLTGGLRLKIDELCKTCETLLSARKFWRFKTTLEVEGGLLRSAGILLPDYYNDGLPVTPEDALSAAELKKRTEGQVELVASSSILKDWNSEQILTSEPGKPITLNLDIPVTGNYRLTVGTVTGGRFGSYSVKYNNQVVGTVKSIGQKVDARNVLFAKPVSLRSGDVNIEFVPESSKCVGISYLKLTPVYTVIRPMRWLISKHYPKQDFDKKLEPEEKLDVSNWTQLKGFGPFVDIACGVPLQYGSIRYAVTYIYSPDARNVRLCYGVDYRVKMWLNGDVIKATGERKKEGVPNRGEESLDMNLKKGWNELLLKVCSGSQGNGFWMEISNMNDLKFSTNPVDQSPKKVSLPEGGKLLHHQDFEKKVAQNKLTTWDGSGSKSFKGKGAAQMGNYFGGAEVEGGKNYVLQAYIQGVIDGHRARVQINWMNENRKLIKYDLTGKKLTTEWQLVRLKAKAPAGAKSAYLIVGTGKGKEWVDEVWFGEIKETK